MNKLAFLALAALLMGINSPCTAASVESSVAATSQPQAQSAARAHAGRQDPMQNIGEMPFPASVTKHHSSRRGNLAGILKPPPPPVAVPFIGDPGTAWGTGSPVDDAKPLSAIHEVQLVSLMDEHAILRVPGDVARKNGWPTTIALNPGEHIGSLKLIATTATQATFEEDGLRLTKGLAP